MPNQGRLEDLAQKGRAADAAGQAQARARTQAAAAKRDRKSQRLIDASFESKGISIPAVAAFGVMFAVYFALLGIVPEDQNKELLTTLPAAAAGSVVLVILFRVTKEKARARELAWLGALPFGFDVEAYLDELTKTHMSSKVVLTVAFAGEVPASERGLIADAAGGAVATSERVWKGAKLRITSAPLETYFSNSGSDAGSSHSNKNVHRWFRSCVEGGLTAIHARHAIASVDLSVGHG